MANEISRQCRQAVVMAKRPAVFDRKILALATTGFPQALEASDERRKRIGRCAAEEPLAAAHAPPPAKLPPRRRAA